MSQQPDATPQVVAGSDQAAEEAAPAPSKQRNTPARASKAEKEPERDPSTRAAELEAELAAVRREATGGDTVRLRVDPDSPHSAMVHGGVYVGEEWTEVPAHVVPDLMEGAANAGVTLTQEETEES